MQILALSLGLTAILLLSFTRGDLLDTWRSKTPPDAPNRFIVNIQPEQREPLAALFAESRIAAPTTYPMVRGRYVELNGNPVDADTFKDRERRLVEREFNLSFMSALPGHNQVTGGAWFGPGDLAPGALSVEEGIAKSLGWKLGDRLTWEVAGQRFTAPITSVRKLDWDSMQVNFFVITTPKLLDGLPDELRDELPSAGVAGRVREPPVAALPEHDGRRHERDPASGQCDDGPGDSRGAVRVPVRARRRRAGAVRGAARDAGRARARGGGDARARREPRPGARGAARGVPRARACRRHARGGRRDRDRLRASRNRCSSSRTR